MIELGALDSLAFVTTRLPIQDVAQRTVKGNIEAYGLLILSYILVTRTLSVISTGLSILYPLTGPAVWQARRSVPVCIQ